MADPFLTFTEHYANPERDPSCGEELFLWDGQDGYHGEPATPAFLETATGLESKGTRGVPC